MSRVITDSGFFHAMNTGRSDANGRFSHEEFKNAVDLMFDELKERDPNHFAVRQYVKYKLAAGVIR